MGFGDPYHKHPLRYFELPDQKGSNCRRCEQPITSTKSYGCTICNYFVHKLCAEMPRKMLHPLHSQHPLVLKNAHKIPNICYKCSEPCNGYTYHCPICKFDLHLSCFFTLEYQHHRQHPLSLFNFQGFNPDGHSCRLCGFLIVGFAYACKSCHFYVHHECTLLPSIVKSHHVHELTLNYGFPEECTQVYCDMCEDRDGKELDRTTTSYYFCKRCDYIAHIQCVTDIKEIEIYHFVHEDHPLSYSGKPPRYYEINECKVCDTRVSDINYHCNECDWVVHESCAKIPPSIKHPIHEKHELQYRTYIDLEYNHVICTVCGEGPINGPNYQCATCECFAHVSCARHIQHPSHDHKHELIFEIESHYKIGNIDGWFRCNGCGDLGNGYNVHCTAHSCNFDLHLECSLFATSTQHESRVSSITQSEEKMVVKDPEPRPLCLYSVGEMKSLQPPLFGTPDDNYKHMGLPSSFPSSVMKETNDEETSMASIFENPGKFRFFNHDHLLTILEEDSGKRILCRVCNRPVFTPAYSCTECEFYLHKSCAELPRTFTSHSKHIFELVENGFSACTYCYRPLEGYSYHCTTCSRVSLHVRCAFMAPILKHNLHEHFLIYDSDPKNLCDACGYVGRSTFFCPRESCSFAVHTKCATLPYVVKRKFHKHPLELAGDLADWSDEYVCDVCEKELNPQLWAYRCSDECKGYATSHLTCVVTSHEKYRLDYELECRGISRELGDCASGLNKWFYSISKDPASWFHGRRTP